MKHTSAVPLIVLCLSSCGPSDVWWLGDIELGDNYYYMVEPAFNSIQTLDTEDENRSIGYVLQDIHLLGFNDDYIAASNRNHEFYIIDKNGISPLSSTYCIKEEVIGPVDSIVFFAFVTEHEISLRSSEQYQEEGGWN